MILRHIALTLLLAGFAADSTAKDLVQTKLMSMELARDIASKAVEACRARGYQVSAVVVDRGGSVQAVLRDVYASRFTIEIAERKANAVILSGSPSADLRRNRADIRQELNHVRDVLVLEGGLPIRAGGSLVGAVGEDANGASCNASLASTPGRSRGPCGRDAAVMASFPSASAGRRAASSMPSVHRRD